MLESIYLSLVVLSFLSLFTSFFANRLPSQVIFLGIACALFAVLAGAAAEIEIATCTSASCTLSNFYFEETVWIFGGFSLASGALFLIKSFDAFNFARGKL